MCMQCVQLKQLLQWNKHRRSILRYQTWIARLHWTVNSIPWWRHQMETFSALLAICAGNSPVTGEFPSQRPVTGNFDVFFHLRLNKQLRRTMVRLVIWDAIAPIMTVTLKVECGTTRTGYKFRPEHCFPMKINKTHIVINSGILNICHILDCQLFICIVYTWFHVEKFL